MKLVKELKLNVGYNNLDIIKAIINACKVQFKDILNYEIIRESIDARRKPNIKYTLNVAVEFSNNVKNKVSKFPDYTVDKSGLEYQKINYSGKRPVIVGFGPSGMFAGLVLSLSGVNPIIIEQGKSVDERKNDVENLWKDRKLNIYSNVQFGEGGAGTFSDGKLNSNLDNAYCKKVINEFILNGAPKEIYYKSKPHIGSDKLPFVVKNIRNKIINNGGTIFFSHKLEDIILENGKVKKILVKDILNNKNIEFETDTLILAIGHSAISTFEMLHNKNVFLEQKPFAMGVRIEQNQLDLNLSQYGSDSKLLPSADYKLVEHLDNGRSVFTFCMCPGGEVVLSSSEENTLVTNGMSNFARNGKNCNSALLVNVNPTDFNDENVLAGLYFQRKYERLAFELGGSDYSAPCQRVDEFLYDKVKNKTKFLSTYRPSLKVADLKKCLPSFVYESLKLAIPKLNLKIKNFAKDENLLIGIESRSSCPVKITRNEYGESLNTKGIFPIGEGAGYAGGILSSCQDGIKIAEFILDKLSSY